jgi:hypothetical protein
MSESIKVRQPRIKVPADRVRTREAILVSLPEGVINHRGWIWVPCWNCNGTGDYPSSMTPPGRCRLLCWAGAHTDPMAQALGKLPPEKAPNDPTYGKLARSIDKYVKQCQADDRAAYRWELGAPAREAAAAVERERLDREAKGRQEEAERRAEDEAARKAVSQWIGTIGERIERHVVLVDRRSFESTYGRRSICRLRDDAGNVLVWFTNGVLGMRVGETGTIKGTVKEHSAYQGERQTVLQRVTILGEPGQIDGRPMTQWERRLRGESDPETNQT